MEELSTEAAVALIQALLKLGIFESKGNTAMNFAQAAMTGLVLKASELKKEELESLLKRGFKTEQTMLGPGWLLRRERKVIRLGDPR